jgi:hypothetical protein
MPIFQDPDQRCQKNTRTRTPVLSDEERGDMRCPPVEEPKPVENGTRDREDVRMADLENLSRVESARMETSDRVELIERIKRGESPTWVPGKAVSWFLLFFGNRIEILDSEKP